MKQIVAIAELDDEVLVCDVRLIDFIKCFLTFDDRVRVIGRFGFKLDEDNYYSFTGEEYKEVSFIKFSVINFRFLDRDDCYAHIFVELSTKLNKRG